ncbi:MAG: caspase family protein [Minicystis sp.]
MIETASTRPCRALLIGVEHYPHHAGKDLRAGRNDVLAFWKVCRRLGYQPGDIRVLTSPVLTMQDLVWAEIELSPETPPSEGEAREQLEKEKAQWLERQGVVLGAADHEQILAGARSLARGLAQRDGAGERESLPGLFTYSGHGAQVEGHLVLCPSDTGKAEGGALPNAISLGELRAIFDAADRDKKEGTPHPTDNLTVVLDCCFAARGVTREGHLVPTLTEGAGRAVEKKRTAIGNRVFCASGPDRSSYQALLGGYWYSAFTWALTVALEQWETDTDGPFAESTVSHNELLFRARTLMRALGFRQHPVFEDGVGLGNQRVFHCGAGRSRPAVGSPNAAWLGGQLNPNQRYEFMTDTSAFAFLADALGDTSTAYAYRGKEYWYWSDTASIPGDNGSNINLMCKKSGIPSDASVQKVKEIYSVFKNAKVTICDTSQPDTIWKTSAFVRDPDIEKGIEGGGLQSYCFMTDKGTGEDSMNLRGFELVVDKDVGIVAMNWFAYRKPTEPLLKNSGELPWFGRTADMNALLAQMPTNYVWAKVGLAKATE